jgi:hypothetical protein
MRAQRSICSNRKMRQTQQQQQQQIAWTARKGLLQQQQQQQVAVKQWRWQPAVQTVQLHSGRRVGSYCGS